MTIQTDVVAEVFNSIANEVQRIVQTPHGSRELEIVKVAKVCAVKDACLLASRMHDGAKILRALIERIEREQALANDAANRIERLLCLARRDALTEIRLRLRGNPPDPHWLERMPT